MTANAAYNFYVMTPVLTLMEGPNTDLLDLTLSDGAQLTPTFARDQHGPYQVNVGNLTESVTVTASAAYPEDTEITVNNQIVVSGEPSQAIDLNSPITLTENASTTIDISVQRSEDDRGGHDRGGHDRGVPGDCISFRRAGF